MKEEYCKNTAKLLLQGCNKSYEEDIQDCDFSYRTPADDISWFAEKVGEQTYMIVFRGSLLLKMNNLLPLLNFLKWQRPSFIQDDHLKLRVSKGIAYQFSLIQNSLYKYLSTIPQGSKIYFSGHSNGGAISKIAALYTEHLFPGYHTINIYTFGSQSVVNKDFKDLIESYRKYSYLQNSKIKNDIIPYFFTNISAIIKKKIPMKTPLRIRFLFHCTNILLKIFKKKYVSVGTTIFLADKPLQETPSLLERSFITIG